MDNVETLIFNMRRVAASNIAQGSVSKNLKSLADEMDSLQSNRFNTHIITTVPEEVFTILDDIVNKRNILIQSAKLKTVIEKITSSLNRYSD